MYYVIPYCVVLSGGACLDRDKRDLELNAQVAVEQAKILGQKQSAAMVSIPIERGTPIIQKEKR